MCTTHTYTGLIKKLNTGLGFTAIRKSIEEAFSVGKIYRPMFTPNNASGSLF